MALLTESWAKDTSLFLVLLVLLQLYIYFRNVYGYFRSKGIPYLRPVPLLGHTYLGRKSNTEVQRELYNNFPGQRFFGFFNFMEPTLLVKDPELIQRIMVKDFAHFQDRSFPMIGGNVLQSLTLFGMRGCAWRALRNKLAPTFSSGKLKMMFSQVTKCGDHLLEKIAEQPGAPLEAKRLTVDFSAKVVASTAFGIEFSKDNPQSVELVSRLTGVFQKSELLFHVVCFLITVVPRLVPWIGLNAAKTETSEYFVNLTKATKKFRLENNIKRNDYFNLLMKVQKGEEITSCDDNEEDKIINQMEYAPEDGEARTSTVALSTDEELTAQAFGFYFAGTETFSSALTFAFYRIAKSRSVQRKLCEEIDSALDKHGGLTYQSIKDMTFMDQVIQESLRIHPPVPFTVRECTLPYQLPGTDIVLETGTKILIPVAGIQMDPKYYPEPQVFKPERFDGLLKPGPTFLPFGDGPRICIAMRFALMEMKVFLAKILSHYQVEVNHKTEEPLVLEKACFGVRSEKGIWINFQKRD